ncbi:helix-turn-helix domain-containing protein [Virgibacillus alimentarius]|nr:MULTISPECIES: helix-turn-helix domain-containing protein [Virgibacillus]HLR66203.1 RodZ domain-containing protein [Virgibacillus sp.]
MEIGTKLKEAREEKGLSLESLQETTKIQKRYLEAIEKGDLHILPGKFYARAFIKEYANAVGLNPSELLEEHKSEVPSTEENEIEYTRLQRSNREKRRGRSNLFNFSFIPTLIVVLLVIAIVFAAWVFYQKTTANSNPDPVPEQNDEIIYSEDAEGESNDNQTDVDDEDEGNDDTEDKKNDSEKPEFSVVEEGSGGSPESELDLNNLKDNVNIKLSLDGDTYIQIDGESGENYLEGMINPDESPEEIDISDEEKVYFNIGNAPALTIEINGTELEYPVDPEEYVHQKIWVNLNKKTE